MNIAQRRGAIGGTTEHFLQNLRVFQHAVVGADAVIQAHHVIKRQHVCMRIARYHGGGNQSGNIQTRGHRSGSLTVTRYRRRHRTRHIHAHMHIAFEAWHVHQRGFQGVFQGIGNDFGHTRVDRLQADHDLVRQHTRFGDGFLIRQFTGNHVGFFVVFSCHQHAVAHKSVQVLTHHLP